MKGGFIMKKFLTIMLTLVFIFGLFACDNNNNPEPPVNTDPPLTACETNDEFADYIIQIYKDVAANDSLYKSLIGDTSAPKVTVEEVEQTTAQWKEVIKNSLSNPDVVIDVHEENGRKTYTFNSEKILNINGVGTHMGAGFPSYLTMEGEKMLSKFVCELGQ